VVVISVLLVVGQWALWEVVSEAERRYHR
jgi:hypothetical protein